jgi:hypothetical protein
MKNSDSVEFDRLVQRIAQIERQTNDVADFSENEAPKRQLYVEDLFYSPEQFDRFRTQVNFCVRLRRVNVEEMEFCKYRTLTKASDYIQAMTEALDFGELFTIATTNGDEDGGGATAGGGGGGRFSLQEKVRLCFSCPKFFFCIFALSFQNINFFKTFLIFYFIYINYYRISI